MCQSAGVSIHSFPASISSADSLDVSTSGSGSAVSSYTKNCIFVVVSELGISPSSATDPVISVTSDV